MKKCRKCKKIKALSSYYMHSGMKDKHFNICKACTKVKTARYRKLNLETIQTYDRHRRASENISEKDKKQRTAVLKKWRKKNRKKSNLYNRDYRRGKIGKAHNAVNRKLKDERPGICTLCKKPSAFIHGHHPDYNKPLDVVWCCPACHGKLHRKEAQLVIREECNVVDVTNIT